MYNYIYKLTHTHTHIYMCAYIYILINGDVTKLIYKLINYHYLN